MLNPGFLLRNSFYASLIVGFICPLVGVYFVLRRIIFLGVAVPQISSAGIAFAFLLHTLGLHPLPHSVEERGTALLGSFLFTFFSILVLAILERRHKGMAEGRIGVAYALGGAASILFVVWNPSGESEILSMLRGNIIAINNIDLLLITGVYFSILIVLIGFQRDFVLISFDPDLAVTIGKNVLLWDILLYLIIGLTISLGVMTVGPLVIFGFLVIPPVAARMLTFGMKPFCIVSSLIGGLSAFLGFYLSYRFDLPTGATDVALLCLVLFASSIFCIVKRHFKK
ncbi:MAG: metal ABC transporter permease [Candidatus Brocadiales bacterium]|nr:metal ABC transporter permease [Candidatus Brocadiales bacterium]